LTITGGCLMADPADTPPQRQEHQGTLADLRKRAGITQAQVAQAMNISRVQVSRIEARFPGVPLVSALAYLKAIGAEDVVLSHPLLGEIPITDVSPDPARQEALERRRASMKNL